MVCDNRACEPGLMNSRLPNGISESSRCRLRANGSERDDLVPLGEELLEARMSLVLVEQPHFIGPDGAFLLEDARAEAARSRDLVAHSAEQPMCLVIGF